MQGNPLPAEAPGRVDRDQVPQVQERRAWSSPEQAGPFLGCNKFPRCRTIVSAKVIERLKELQATGEWPPKDPARAQEILNELKGEKAEKAAAKK
jgi:ssDNA-binding Zn-finger/Zn-ribbon topoisomerase 1